LHNCNNNLGIISYSSSNNGQDAASNEIIGYTLDDLASFPIQSGITGFGPRKRELLLGAEIEVFSTPVPKLVLRSSQPPV